MYAIRSYYAIFCVAMATRLLGRPISLEQIKHNFPSDFEGNGLLLLSSVFKHVDVKAKITPKRLPELNQQLFPVVVQRNDGLFSLVSKIDKENKKILVQNVDDSVITSYSIHYTKLYDVSPDNPFSFDF